MSDKDEGSQTGKRSYIFWLMVGLGVVCVLIIIAAFGIYAYNSKNEQGDAQSASNTTGLTQKENNKDNKTVQKEDGIENKNGSGLMSDANINSPFNLIEKSVPA